MSKSVQRNCARCGSTFGQSEEVRYMLHLAGLPDRWCPDCREVWAEAQSKLDGELLGGKRIEVAVSHAPRCNFLALPTRNLGERPCNCKELGYTGRETPEAVALAGEVM